MKVLFSKARLLFDRDDGPTATEYAVMLALIAVLVLATMANFGEKVENIYLALSTAVEGVF